MLNKLLKRCMPWMDKGRWYKVVLEPSNGGYVVGAGTDPAYQNTNPLLVQDDYGNFIIVLHSGILIRDLKIREFHNTSLAYITALSRSDIHGAEIFIPSWFAVTPDNGNSLEILIFGV